MFRNYVSLSVVLLVVAATVLVGLTGVSRAETISFAVVQDDASAGITSTGYNFDFAIDVNTSTPRTVNGVAFTPVSTPTHNPSYSGNGANGTSWSLTNPTVGGQFNWYSVSSGTTGNIGGVITNFVTPAASTEPTVVMFGGLTPNKEYTAVFYGNPWQHTDLTRPMTLTTSLGGSFDFNEDGPDVTIGGVAYGSRVTDVYTAPAGGSVTFTFTTRDPTSGYLLIGFANSSVVPEPSTVVLLVTGLLGLLCYAWRKRK